MNTYFERYAYPDKLFLSPPVNSLKISVVIPCFNEPDICTTLTSLSNCEPVSGVEVIIIINEPASSTRLVREQNRKSIKEIKNWNSENKPFFELLQFYLKAPDKIAGVGFARKVGMDEAARRFEKIGYPEGIICCFDADSTCAPNYLTSIEQNFTKSKIKPKGASIYFEHILPANLSHQEGIVQYELHLRYYVSALRFAVYPFAHQTVGSSMAVRSDIYQKVGGMNKRKAGEDFYFLHRVMPSGDYIDITETTVYPSARISNRVPFGTGKAMAKWQNEEQKHYYSYNLKSFSDLKSLFKNVNGLFQEDRTCFEKWLNNLPDSISSFLLQDKFHEVAPRLIKQSRNIVDFRRNWFYYFNGFKVLKYLHHSRDNYYKDESIISLASSLQEKYWPEDKPNNHSAMDWLTYYRKKDKES